MIGPSNMNERLPDMTSYRILFEGNALQIERKRSPTSNRVENNLI